MKGWVVGVQHAAGGPSVHPSYGSLVMALRVVARNRNFITYVCVLGILQHDLFP